MFSASALWLIKSRHERSFIDPTSLSGLFFLYLLNNYIIGVQSARLVYYGTTSSWWPRFRYILRALIQNIQQTHQSLGLIIIYNKQRWTCGSPACWFGIMLASHSIWPYKSRWIVERYLYRFEGAENASYYIYTICMATLNGRQSGALSEACWLTGAPVKYHVCRSPQTVNRRSRCRCVGYSDLVSQNPQVCLMAMCVIWNKGKTQTNYNHRMASDADDRHQAVTCPPKRSRAPSNRVVAKKRKRDPDIYRDLARWTKWAWDEIV